MQIQGRPTLWRLYTDTTFRKEFIFDKERFYQKYDVPVDIIDLLEDTPIDELTFFADGLLKKRMIRVKSFLPLTFRLLGKDLQMLFFKFCDRYTFAGVERHREDAIQFIHYLLQQRVLSQKDNLYIKAVLKFEQQQLVNYNSSNQLVEPDEPDFIRMYRAALRQKLRQKRPLQQFSEIEDWLRLNTKKKSARKYPILFL